MVIAREDLPEDAKDWTEISVSLPFLEDNSPASSPRSEDEIFNYVNMESADCGSADRGRLKFIRTAGIEDNKFWLWEYTEKDDEPTFVCLKVEKDGTSLLGLASPNGLSYEQYLLAEHYEEIYWS